MAVEAHVQISFRFVECFTLTVKGTIYQMCTSHLASQHGKRVWQKQLAGRWSQGDRIDPSGSLISVTCIRKPWIHIPTQHSAIQEMQHPNCFEPARINSQCQLNSASVSLS